MKHWKGILIVIVIIAIVVCLVAFGSQITSLLSFSSTGT
jgi:hypothetical protein